MNGHHTQCYKCKIELLTSPNEVTLVSSYVCSNNPTISAMIEKKAHCTLLKELIYRFRMRICAIFTGLLFFVCNLELISNDVCV